VIVPDDEQPHAAPSPAPPRWQENYFVLGWDDALRTGFTVHLERFPDRGDVEVKADVSVGDALVSTSEHHALTSEVGAGPVTVEVEEPFRRWHLRAGGRGVSGRGPLGFVGHRGDATAAYELDVVIESPLGGVDHGEALKALALPGTERDHYEACGTWRGVVTAGDRRVEGEGHFVRDHTWGVRGYSALTAAWWYPSCFDDGARYLGGALVGYGEQWGGYAIVADARGVDATTAVTLDAGSAPRFGTYDTTRLVAQFPERGEIVMTSRSRLHLPHSFPGFADRYFASDALSVLDWDGATGFGVRELNGYLDPDEAALVEPE
jgi:hypothetical protein